MLEIVTLEFPVLVTVTVFVEDKPAFTLPKARLVALNERVCEAATPVPVNAIAVGEFGALLTIDTDPVTLPAEAGLKTILKFVDWLAPNEIGKANVLVLKPLPAALICEIVSVPVPLLVSCTVCELGEPTVTPPKLALDGVIVNAGWMPEPLTGITAVAPLELATVMLPVMFSDAEGLKLMLRVAFFPAFNVSGVVTPLTPKSFAFTEISETVKLLLPLLLMVTFLELLVPALTFPNAMLVGLAESVTDAATPVPVKATAFGELGALLEILTPPVSAPAVVGAKSTLNVVLAPAVTVAGVLSPLTLYPGPVAEICAMVNAAVPVLVTVKLCDLVCPSTTLPKLKVEGEIERPACVPLPVSGIVSVALDASLDTIIDPGVLPAVVGLYVAVSVADAEGLSVAGVAKPVIE